MRWTSEWKKFKALFPTKLDQFINHHCKISFHFYIARVQVTLSIS